MQKRSLGFVTAPSGKLVIVDPGYLDCWCHDGPPMMPDGVLSSPAATAKANDAVDLVIVGRDAEAVGKAFDRQWNPHFVFDIPREGVDTVKRGVAELARARGLDAHAEIAPERIAHRRRVDLALAHGHGAGEVQFHGIWAAVVGELPAGELRVVAEPMPKGPEETRLRRITIEVREGTVSRSDAVAQVMVDAARLLVIDADVLAQWTTHDSLDGKADFVFWGLDAAKLAEEIGAPSLDETMFGWANLPIDDALREASRTREKCQGAGWKVGMDFRPHSHHYELMREVRASATKSGVVNLGGAVACGFMTSWGDGIFDVYRDRDAQGRVVRVRIELGTDERVALMAKLNLRWSTSALVSKKVTEESEPVRFMYREKPDHAGDSGWRMFSGYEAGDYNENPDNIAIVALSEFASLDKRVDALLDAPEGSVFERTPGKIEFERVTDWKPRGE